MRLPVYVFMCCSLLLVGCQPRIAVVDVNKILVSSPHAGEARDEAKKAQEIYQYNLGVVEKKLSLYKNKKQAQEYLLEAARQLQLQLDSSRAAISQSMAGVLQTVIDQKTSRFDLVVARGTVLSFKEKLDITDLIQEEYDAAQVAFPEPPRRVDSPRLPVDRQ